MSPADYHESNAPSQRYSLAAAVSGDASAAGARKIRPA
jgi:hypothetical protein